MKFLVLKRSFVVSVASLVTLLMVLLPGCGDTFRPVPNPITGPGGNPEDVKNAVVLSSPCGSAAIATEIDVAGDSVALQMPLGVIATIPCPPSPAMPPLINLDPTTDRVFISNTFEDTITTYSALQIPAAGGAEFPVPPTTTTISLPVGSAPVYAQQAPAGSVYVALSGRTSTGAVGVVDGTTFELTTVITDPAITNPVFIAALPAGGKVYSINRGGTSATCPGSNTVSAISTVDNTISATICVGVSPVWAAFNADGSKLFVINQGSPNGSDISVIDTTTDTVAQTLGTDTSRPTATDDSPNYAVFNVNRNRLYVTNSGSGALSVIAGATTPLTLLRRVSLGAGAKPVSVAALTDGSRVYVADAAGGVSVVNALSFSVKPIAIPAGSFVSIASTSDSNKVYAVDGGSNKVYGIRTSDDTVTATLPVPATATYVVVTP